MQPYIQKTATNLGKVYFVFCQVPALVQFINFA